MKRGAFVATSFVAAFMGALAAPLKALGLAPKDDVFTNGSSWVIATSAEEARVFYIADCKSAFENYERRYWGNQDGRAWESTVNLAGWEFTFERCDLEDYGMYYDDAHEDYERDCPMCNSNLPGDGESCDECSPYFSREELIEQYGHGAVIREYDR